MAPLKILIAEDEMICALALQRELEDLGYQVCEIATKGQEAVDFTSAFRPDIILMDILLSDNISGIEAVKTIHASEFVPVIYMTASEDPDTLEKIKETRYTSLITKPYNIYTLKQALKHAQKN